jgi:hypothetical protein
MNWERKNYIVSIVSVVTNVLILAMTYAISRESVELFLSEKKPFVKIVPVSNLWSDGKNNVETLSIKIDEAPELTKGLGKDFDKSKIEINFTIENTGQLSADRVQLDTVANTFPISNVCKVNNDYVSYKREFFMFHKLRPGETRDIKIEIPLKTPLGDVSDACRGAISNRGIEIEVGILTSYSKFFDADKYTLSLKNGRSQVDEHRSRSAAD